MKCAQNLYRKLKKGSAKKDYIQADDHLIYYRHICNNPTNETVIIVHGGPGSAISDNHVRYFNPQKYNIVQFDQRLSGKSTSSSNNLDNVSLQHLINDIDTIRQTLNLDKVILFGISWGGSVALAYAGMHHQFVSQVILLNPLIINKDSQQWIFSDAAKHNPHLQQAFDNINAGCIATKIIDQNCEQSMLNWLNWEASLAGMQGPQSLNDSLKKRCILALHYFKRDSIISSDKFEQLIKDIPEHITVKSLHGINDIAVSPNTASFLQQTVKNNEVMVIDSLGHSASNDPAWNKYVTDLTDRL